MKSTSKMRGFLPVGVLFCTLAILSAQSRHVGKRQAVELLPPLVCEDFTEGMLWSDTEGIPVAVIWICHNGRWIRHHITPFTGKTREEAGQSCKDLKDTLTTECKGSPPTGTYWINVTDSCDGEQDSMRVYCEMSMDGGGWTLVWKHSYMEVGTLSEDMKYFSKHYRPCTDIETGWCNVPYKARLNPTEMMIVAYRNKTARYAYKGWFNYNIDYNWRGGILVEPKKILDQCTWTDWTSGIAPAPRAQGGDRGLLGIAFNKHYPINFYSSSDTICDTFSTPQDCRWRDCEELSSPLRGTQMTMAIYVR